MKITADIVVDISFGDCGKGWLTHALLEHNKHEYTHCMRFCGGHNAGHTIYLESNEPGNSCGSKKKLVTHILPTGLALGIPSIIGPGCVINPDKLLDELDDLAAIVTGARGNLIIANNAHLIMQEHLEEDKDESKIGTTQTGNGPAYRDKAARTGHRAEQSASLAPFTKDVYQVLHNTIKPVIVLMEGAQGFGLDIDWGDYPYVTSSACTVGGAVQNGIPPQSIRNIYGVIKPYETYVGSKEFEAGPDVEIFEQIRQIGQEFGATTGRARQVNWLNLELLERGSHQNGITHLIINKMDVMDKVGVYKTRLNNGEVIKHHNKEDFVWELEAFVPPGTQIYLSYSPTDRITDLERVK